MEKSKSIGDFLIKIGAVAGAITAVIVLTDLIGITHFSNKTEENSEGKTSVLNQEIESNTTPNYSEIAAPVAPKKESSIENSDNTGSSDQTIGITKSDLPVCPLEAYNSVVGFMYHIRTVKPDLKYGGVVFYSNPKFSDDDDMKFLTLESDVFLKTVVYMEGAAAAFTHLKSGRVGYVKSGRDVVITCYEK